jgi:hypothetical protein
MPEKAFRARPRHGLIALRKRALARSESSRSRTFFGCAPRHSLGLCAVPKANEAGALTIAVVDGPYDAAALSGILGQAPVNLSDGSCGANPSSGCDHGTFVMGLLGARRDAAIPGLCPGCRILHVPLFVDEHQPSASVGELANAIRVAVAAGARLINLSLAILGDDSRYDRELAAALDYAEVNGAVVVVAAGNQGRLAMGQLLSHPATVPVVAVDAALRLLPNCNFGPAISRRGVAAIGHQVIGYAPGGRMAVMSGTSVAAAIATGTLAQLWSERPHAHGRIIRAAVARLVARDGSRPAILERDAFLAAIDRMPTPTDTAFSLRQRSSRNYASLQGDTVMTEQNGVTIQSNRAAEQAASSTSIVTAAHGPGGCACGAPGGVCTCESGGSPPSRFIYVLGTVDIKFPDQSVSDELQTVAQKKGIVQGDKEDLRAWCFRVLTNPEARYVARKICWVLTVEGHPAYYLSLRDLHDLPELIGCLNRNEDDLDLVVGSSSLIPIDGCPGVTAPVLYVDRLSVFERRNLLTWVKAPSRPAFNPPSKAKALASKPADLFDKLVQSADNFGDTDEWRALNYLAINYQVLYQQCAVMSKNGWTLDGVRVTTSRLSREKHIVDPVFSFRQIETGLVQKYFVRVDVSHLFPMMVNHLNEYFDR